MGVKRNFAGPVSSTTGTNTMQIASVDTKAGVAICCAPSRMAAMSPFPGLEEHLDHADATQGLRFDAPDIIDGARGHILTVGGDTCGHVVRGEAAILPEDGDDRNIDRGEDIRRHAANGQATEP